MSNENIQLSKITRALEDAWSAIQLYRPEVRPAVIVPYLNKRTAVGGHFAKKAWRVRGSKDNGEIDEVHVNSLYFEQGAEEVLHILLHEAVHSYAQALDIQDTSRQGRWHNKKFEKLAQEFGLVINKSPSVGCITTGLEDDTEHRFRDVLRVLEPALTLYQQPKPKTPGKRTTLKAVCPSCERVLRASRKTFDMGPILCDPCGEFFEVEE